MPTRMQQNIDQVITNLKAMTTAGGYSFDVNPDHVSDTPDIPANEARVPAIGVYGPFLVVDDLEDNQLHLQIEIDLIDVGSASIGSVRQKSQDIIRAVQLTADQDFCNHVKFKSVEYQVERENRRYADALLTFDLVYYAENFGESDYVKI